MSLRVLNNEPGFAEQQDHEGFSVICNIPSLGLSCFGCCGHHFADKESMHQFFDENKETFEHFKKTGRSAKEFMNREQLLDPCGGCYSLMREQDSQGRDQYYCGVHPFRIGEEVREKYCDHDYLCKTAAHVQKMTLSEKKLFYEFLAEQKFDSYEYSIINEQETVLLEMYREWKKKKDEN